MGGIVKQSLPTSPLRFTVSGPSRCRTGQRYSGREVGSGERGHDVEEE